MTIATTTHGGTSLRTIRGRGGVALHLYAYVGPWISYLQLEGSRHADLRDVQRRSVGVWTASDIVEVGQARVNNGVPQCL